MYDGKNFPLLLFMFGSSIVVWLLSINFLPEPYNVAVERGWFWVGLFVFISNACLRTIPLRGWDQYTGMFLASIIAWPWVLIAHIVVWLRNRNPK